MDSLTELYKEIILDHYCNPRNHGQLEAPDVATRGYNPLCGDELDLSLSFGDGTLGNVAFTGRGCSISQASASMMTEAVKGRRLEEVDRMVESFKDMMTGQGGPDALEALGAGEELGALQGIKRYPVRIKCALLGWNTLREALELYRSRHP